MCERANEHICCDAGSVSLAVVGAVVERRAAVEDLPVVVVVRGFGWQERFDFYRTLGAVYRFTVSDIRRSAYAWNFLQSDCQFVGPLAVTAFVNATHSHYACDGYSVGVDTDRDGRRAVAVDDCHAGRHFPVVACGVVDFGYREDYFGLTLTEVRQAVAVHNARIFNRIVEFRQWIGRHYEAYDVARAAVVVERYDCDFAAFEVVVEVDINIRRAVAGVYRRVFGHGPVVARGVGNRLRGVALSRALTDDAFALDALWPAHLFAHVDCHDVGVAGFGVAAVAVDNARQVVLRGVFHRSDCVGVRATSFAHFDLFALRRRHCMLHCDRARSRLRDAVEVEVVRRRSALDNEGQRSRFARTNCGSAGHRHCRNAAYGVVRAASEVVVDACAVLVAQARNRQPNGVGGFSCRRRRVGVYIRCLTDCQALAYRAVANNQSPDVVGLVGWRQIDCCFHRGAKTDVSVAVDIARRTWFDGYRNIVRLPRAFRAFGLVGVDVHNAVGRAFVVVHSKRVRRLRDNVRRVGAFDVVTSNDHVQRRLRQVPVADDKFQIDVVAGACVEVVAGVRIAQTDVGFGLMNDDGVGCVAVLIAFVVAALRAAVDERDAVRAGCQRCVFHFVARSWIVGLQEAGRRLAGRRARDAQAIILYQFAVAIFRAAAYDEFKCAVCCAVAGVVGYAYLADCQRVGLGKCHDAAYAVAVFVVFRLNVFVVRVVDFQFVIAGVETTDGHRFFVVRLGHSSAAAVETEDCVRRRAAVNFDKERAVCSAVARTDFALFGHYGREHGAGFVDVNIVKFGHAAVLVGDDDVVVAGRQIAYRARVFGKGFVGARPRFLRVVVVFVFVPQTFIRARAASDCQRDFACRGAGYGDVGHVGADCECCGRLTYNYHARCHLTAEAIADGDVVFAGAQIADCVVVWHRSRRTAPCVVVAARTAVGRDRYRAVRAVVATHVDNRIIHAHGQRAVGTNYGVAFGHDAAVCHVGDGHGVLAADEARLVALSAYEVCARARPLIAVVARTASDFKRYSACRFAVALHWRNLFVD